MIARNGEPYLRLQPYDLPLREPGPWKGKVWLAPDFDETGQEIIDAFEGEDGQFHRSVHGAGHDDRCQYKHRPMEVPACQAHRWRCTSARRFLGR